MKKWIMFFVGFAILISLILLGLQNTPFILTDSNNGVIETVLKTKEVDLNNFIKLYKENKFKKIELKDSTKLLGYELVDDSKTINSMLMRQTIKELDYNQYNTNKPADTSLWDLGISLTWQTQVVISYTEKWLWDKAMEVLPLLITIVVVIIFFRILSSKWSWFPFGAQAGKLKTKAEIKTNFNDVAGMEEVKEELKEVVDYLKNPKKYIKVWARIPRWLLLYWPPWSWKTLVARAVAWEADVPFFAASGSEFMEMLVWMWAAKVRELFNKAKAAAPSIIFIDEIDTIGKKRWAWYTGWHQEQEQTLNQILTEMDGFDKDSKVIVMAATNRPDILDPALLRPWRFDRKTYIGRPTLEERLEILKIHCKDKKLDKSVDLEVVARRTSWFVWADLANVANEAALKVARENREVITMDDLEFALEKTVMGPEKKRKSIKEKEKKIIAYHELGHAVNAYFAPNSDPVEKISIVSRGMALWVTWILPQEDTYLYSKNKFYEEIAIFLGWRAAEEVFFGKDEITTWASNDFEKATAVARDMILKYWMDEELGPMQYYDRDNWEWTPFKPFSEKTAEIIDQKIKTIISTCYEKSLKNIKDNKNVIEDLAKILLNKEYITKEEFAEIMKDPEKAKEMILQSEKKLAETKAEEEKKEKDKKLAQAVTKKTKKIKKPWKTV